MQFQLGSESLANVTGMRNGNRTNPTIGVFKYDLGVVGCGRLAPRAFRYRIALSPLNGFLQVDLPPPEIQAGFSELDLRAALPVGFPLGES